MFDDGGLLKLLVVTFQLAQFRSLRLQRAHFLRQPFPFAFGRRELGAKFVQRSVFYLEKQGCYQFPFLKNVHIFMFKFISLRGEVTIMFSNLFQNELFTAAAKGTTTPRSS